MKNRNTKNKDFLLIELLESFSKSELEGLQRFVGCTYFNTDQYVVKLLALLVKKILHKKSMGQDVQYVVYQEIFSVRPVLKQPLNAKEKAILHTKMSALTRLAEQFLMTEALEDEPAYKSDLLQKKLLEKKQHRLFERHVKKNRKLLSAQLKGIPYYEHLYKIETGQLNYLSNQGQLGKKDNLPALKESLDFCYLLNRLHLHLSSLSLMAISGQRSYDFSVMQSLNTLLNFPKYAEHPLIKTYQAAINLMQEKTNEDYIAFLDRLNKQASSMLSVDLDGFYMIARNFCIHQIKAGHLSYYRHLFDLYRIMADQKLLFIDNDVPLGKFKNVISVSCRVEEFDWAIHLVEAYCPFVLKEVRNSVYDFSMGTIAFYRKDYNLAIDHLYNVGNINLAYDINRRMMILKSYYELETEYKEPTMQTFRSTEKYINENKALTAKDKRAYKNFIRLFINLYRIRHRATKMSLNRVKEKLEQQEFNSDKKWLLEKIELLGG